MVTALLVCTLTLLAIAAIAGADRRRELRVPIRRRQRCRRSGELTPRHWSRCRLPLWLRQRRCRRPLVRLKHLPL